LFERFTDRSRRVVVSAQEEARLLNHDYIGTEHLLLGLIREGQGVPAQVLVKLGGDLSRVRQQVIKAGPAGGRLRRPSSAGRRPLTIVETALPLHGGPGTRPMDETRLPWSWTGGRCRLTVRASDLAAR
jgi:hypothetical protein